MSCAFSARARAMGIFDVRASSSPQATFVPKFVFVMQSAAELAHLEESRTQSLSDSPSLFYVPGTEVKASVWNKLVHKWL